MHITYRLKGLGRDRDGEVDLAEALSAYGVHKVCEPLLLLLAPQHARCSKASTFFNMIRAVNSTVSTHPQKASLSSTPFDLTCQQEQQAHRLDAPGIQHCLGVRGEEVRRGLGVSCF